MIRYWKISNFKVLPAVSQEVLDLRNLNILVGPNSSGKSTLLQSILMVAQTLRNSSSERPLILNGELVRLGHATEVLHEKNEDKPLLLSFTLVPRETGAERTKPVSWQANAVKVDIEFALPFEGALSFDLIRSDLSRGENVGVIAHRIVSGRTITNLAAHTDWQLESFLRSQVEKGWFDYTVLRQSGEGFAPDAAPDIGIRYTPHVSFFHFLPAESLDLYDWDAEYQAGVMRQLADALVGERSLTIQDSLSSISLTNRQLVDEIKESIQTVIHTSGRGERQRGNPRAEIGTSTTEQTLQILIKDLTSVNNVGDLVHLAHQKLIPTTKKKLAQQLRVDAADIEVKSRQKSRRMEGKIGMRSNPMPPDIRIATQEIIDFFAKRLRYIGPLRDDPRAIYGIPMNPESKDVGSKGEFTAAVLQRYKEELVNYPVPPENGQPLGKTRTGSLMHGIIEWLKYMDLVEEVVTHDLGKIGYELKVKSPGVTKELDLTNVGVGVSQVLPTLVAALLAPSDAIVLLEQPELHLHPKVQSRLGDFVLCVSLTGRQCIVETHSEYLFNRVRRRIAEAEGRTLLDKTSLFFVEKEDGGAKFIRIEPNEYGAIRDWPKGFFDEGPAEANLILEAAMKKKKDSKK